MKRVFKTLFKVIVILLTSLLFTLIVMACAVLIWPQIVVNEKAFQFAAPYALRYAREHGVEISWQKSSLQIVSLALVKKRVQLNLGGFCVHVPTVQFQGCAPLVRFNIAVDLYQLKFLELGPLEVQQFRWAFGRILATRCDLNFTSGHPKSRLHLDLTCPVVATFPPFANRWIAQQIPNEIHATIKASIESSTLLPSAETRISGKGQVILDPVRTAALEGHGTVDVELVRGILGQPLTSWEFQSQPHVVIEIPQFERLVQTLRDGPFAIPAPFQVLRGLVAMELQGAADLRVGKVPFQLRTHLTSQTQLLKTSGTGVLEYEDLFTQPKWNLKCDLMLNQVQLVLPKLDWAKPPSLVPDARIKAGAKQGPAEGKSKSFKYTINIETPMDHPALLLSNLAERKIPITVQLMLSDSAPPSGIVRLASFPVEVLHRKAEIHYLQLSLRSPMVESLLFGEIQAEFVDYKITIQLGATLEHPQVNLKSEPPLPESDLVSVLLYGRKLDELNSAESSSVVNTRSAIADRALGLASLYFLASTPIQSLSYDPTSGLVSAKLKLGEGTSLNLGSNAKDSSTIGIQQRLGKNWTLQTDIGNSDTSRGTASASLQWSKRY